MKKNDMKIEDRLQNMKNFYVKAGELIDKLPDSIPEKTRDMIKNAILGDKDLKKLMEGIDSHRPPSPDRTYRSWQKQLSQCSMRLLCCKSQRYA